MASSLRGYLRRLRLFNSGRSDRSWRSAASLCDGPWLCPICHSGQLLRHASWCDRNYAAYLKLLEPNRQPIAVRPVLDPVRPIDQRFGDSLQVSDGRNDTLM